MTEYGDYCSCIIYGPDAQKIVYDLDDNKRCDRVGECSNVSENFLQQCVKQGFDVVTYQCCNKACSGKIK